MTDLICDATPTTCDQNNCEYQHQVALQVLVSVGKGLSYSPGSPTVRIEGFDSVVGKEDDNIKNGTS